MVALKKLCINRFLKMQNNAHVSAFLLELYLRGEIPAISQKQFIDGMRAFFRGFYAEAPFPEITAFAPLRPTPAEFPVPEHKTYLALAVILHELHESHWIRLDENELNTVTDLCLTAGDTPLYKPALTAYIKNRSISITIPSVPDETRKLRLACLKTFHSGR